MELYLVQHGEAVSEQEDPARPLSARGRREVEAVARAAARIGLRVELIVHSDKLRARQTAEVLAAALRPARGTHQLPGLAPGDDQEAALRVVEGASGPLMLVGHLPPLARLAGLLLAGDADREVVAFRMGAVVALERSEAGFRLRYVITPEIAGAEAH